MPEIMVHLAEGRTAEQKKNLLRKITEATVECLGVPLDRVVVQIIEAKGSDKSRGGVLYSEKNASVSELNLPSKA